MSETLFIDSELLSFGAAVVIWMIQNRIVGEANNRPVPACVLDGFDGAQTRRSWVFGVGYVYLELDLGGVGITVKRDTHKSCHLGWVHHCFGFSLGGGVYLFLFYLSYHSVFVICWLLLPIVGRMRLRL
jgi:hypothetical protein